MKKRIHLVNPKRAGIVLSVIIMLFIVGVVKSEAVQEEKAEYYTIVVENGDTLWEISKKYYGNSIDVRKKIVEIKQLNSLKNSNIRVGQTLILMK